MKTNPLAFHSPQSQRELLDLKELVPTQFQEIEIEIGPGTGRFLKTMAIQKPNSFFIGIDKRKDRVKSTERKIKSLESQNALVVYQDARYFQSEQIPEISALHVYHPDPWPKKKHHKHRLFRSPEAKIFAEKIKEGGLISISTDHSEYYEEICSIVESWGLFQHIKKWKKNSGTPQSRFEEIFFNKEEFVYYFTAIKKKT